MASLNSLRTRGGVIVTIVIFIALIAFLIGDFFSAGSNFFNSRKMRVGEINGNKIGYVDFYNRSENLAGIFKLMYGRENLSAQEMETVYSKVWEDFMLEYSYGPGFDNLGLTVSAAEQRDMLNGMFISPVITQFFYNPSTGGFDEQLLEAFMTNAAQNAGANQIWKFIKNEMTTERLNSKFQNLVSAGFYVNDLEIAQSMRTTSNVFSADVVSKAFNTVPDSLVNISKADITKFYNAHKAKFRQNEARDVEYVVFNMVPSEEDFAEAEKTVNELAEEFRTTENPMQFATLNSQVKTDSRFYKESELTPPLAAIAFGSDKGTMLGPTLSGNTYTLSRLAETKVEPDSLGAMHILLDMSQRKLADSLMTIIRNGAPFETLAMEHSMDPSAANNLGDLGRFTPESMVPEFSQGIIAHNVGDVFTVDSQFGIHVVKVTYKGRPVTKAQIATITYNIEPSSSTMNSIFNQANKFLTATGNTLDGFRNAVNDEALSKRSIRINNTDRTISGLGDARELLRWAFTNKAGTVSQMMEIDGNYVVAAITGIREQGFASEAQVSDEIRNILIKEAKGVMIADELRAAGSDIAGIAQNLGKEVVAVEAFDGSLTYIPGIGYEPRLAGAFGGVQEGVLSNPVIGNAAVYIFKLTEIAPSEKDVTPESERTRLEANTQYYLSERLAQAMREQSEVSDMRIKFF